MSFRFYFYAGLVNLLAAWAFMLAAYFLARHDRRKGSNVIPGLMGIAYSTVGGLLAWLISFVTGVTLGATYSDPHYFYIVPFASSFGYLLVFLAYIIGRKKLYPVIF